MECSQTTPKPRPLATLSPTLQPPTSMLVSTNSHPPVPCTILHVSPKVTFLVAVSDHLCHNVPCFVTFLWICCG